MQGGIIVTKNRYHTLTVSLSLIAANKTVSSTMVPVPWSPWIWPADHSLGYLIYATGRKRRIKTTFVYAASYWLSSHTYGTSEILRK